MSANKNNEWDNEIHKELETNSIKSERNLITYEEVGNYENDQKKEFMKSMEKELTHEEKLDALVKFDEKGSPDQMTEEQKLEMMKRQWELFEQHWKQLGRRQKRKLIKPDSRYSSKLKQRLKNI